MSSAICFNLDQSKVLSSGNRLTLYHTILSSNNLLLVECIKCLISFQELTSFNDGQCTYACIFWLLCNRTDTDFFPFATSCFFHVHHRWETKIGWKESLSQPNMEPNLEVMSVRYAYNWATWSCAMTLTHSHTMTPFDAPRKQAYWKHCGKRRNCS